MDSNWAMVIITSVYVIATIVICVANIKSANASKKQLIETKKQYEDSDRPIVEAEFLYINRLLFGIRFVNVGRHTAQNVKISISDEFVNGIRELEVSEYIEKLKEKSCVIGVNQHYDLIFGSYSSFKAIEHKNPARGQVYYTYNSKEYSSEFYFDFENYMTIFSVQTSNKETDLFKEIRNTNYELDCINNSIITISKQLNSLIDNTDIE